MDASVVNEYETTPDDPADAATGDAAGARAEAAEARERNLRAQLAFVRAAGSRLVDIDAAWKLADKSLIDVGEDGIVTGASDAVDRLLEVHPFIAASQPREHRGTNPFPGASGRPMSSLKRLRVTAFDEARLIRKYPALQRHR